MTPEQQATAILRFLYAKCGWDIDRPDGTDPHGTPDPEVVEKLAEWIRDGGLQ